MHQVSNLEPFLTIDINLQCFDSNDDQNVVEQILETMTDQPSDDDSETEHIPVTQQHARKCIEDLWKYFMQEGNENSPMAALEICNDFVNSPKK